MNVKLQYPVTFYANVWVNGRMVTNNYNVVLDIITGTEDGYEQNIAFDRIRFMIQEQFANSVFVDQEETDVVERLRNAGLRVIALPEVPVDQIIGMSLLYKLNSVTEDRMVVVQSRISSHLSENVVYFHSVDDSAGPFMDDGWWDSPKPTCNTEVRSSKIVDIAEETWTALGLQWEPVDEWNDDNVVEFTKADD